LSGQGMNLVGQSAAVSLERAGWALIYYQRNQVWRGEGRNQRRKGNRGGKALGAVEETPKWKETEGRGEDCGMDGL